MKCCCCRRCIAIIATCLCVFSVCDSWSGEGEWRYCGEVVIYGKLSEAMTKLCEETKRLSLPSTNTKGSREAKWAVLRHDGQRFKSRHNSSLGTLDTLFFAGRLGDPEHVRVGTIVRLKKVERRVLVVKIIGSVHSPNIVLGWEQHGGEGWPRQASRACSW